MKKCYNKMLSLFDMAAFFFVFVCASAACFADGEKLLIFHGELGGFTHGSTPYGVSLIEEFALENNFTTDESVSPDVFTDANLEQYTAIAFINTGGDFMNDAQKSAFQNFIRSGKGYLGTHSADFTLHAWDWYHEMLGSKFQSDFGPLDATFHVVDKNHASTRDLPDTFVSWQQLRKNEFYFDDSSEDFRILVKADPSQYDDGRTFLPYVYTHEFEGGRIWYGGMGHTIETFTTDEQTKACVLGGVLYALGRPGADGTTAVLRSPRKSLQPVSVDNIPADGSLQIFDLTGRSIGIVENRNMTAASPFDLRAMLKHMVPSGQYLLRYKTADGDKIFKPLCITK